jgi:hydroxymethylpyrimidine pyrophosphatase-like HAD family hydrolase
LGKSYAEEVAYISDAYQWAIGQEIEPLKVTISRMTAHGLICVGSGGSFTAASFQSFLHESITGRLSYASPPYQLLSKRNAIRNAGVSVLSAEGKNKDVLGCFQYLIASEPQDLMALTLKPDSPLNKIAADSNFASSIGFSMPWEKDGYLATNSLIATCILLYRAYQESFEHLLPQCPDNVEDILEECIEIEASNKADFLKSLGNDRTKAFLVVTGQSGQIAGIDLESRIAESALGTCQVVDFRSFAHGRHLWISQNEKNAASIVIWSEEDQYLYENFCETVSGSLPILSIKLKGRQYLRELASVIAIVQLIKDLSDVHGIDPGQPEVSRTGRSIHELDAFTRHLQSHQVSSRDWAITRKFGGAHLYGENYVAQFNQSYSDFMTQLTETKFGAIVFDYDATLSTLDKRYDKLDPFVAKTLNKLLSQGIKIGIATGRGKSVPNSIREFFDESYRADFLIGMYNGSNIQTLSAELESCEGVGSQFENFLERIEKEPFFNSVFKPIEKRQTQLSFQTKDGACCELAWRTIIEILQEQEFRHLKALRSTHSWDVIEQDTSKTRVSDLFIQQGLKVLSIGDRGLWPGNDCELLSYGLGLGVDEVSPAIDKAWNIAPQGLKGVGATLYYLNNLKISNASFTYGGVTGNE